MRTVKEIATDYAAENGLTIKYLPKGGAMVEFLDEDGHRSRLTRQRLYGWEIARIPPEQREPWMEGY